MQSIGYNIPSTNGAKLYFRYWPATDPKTVICLVHGLGEHSGRYEEWANKFLEKGFAVTAIDYRGHGNASGRRGHASSYAKILEDIDQLLNETQKHFPNAAQILYGHSLGGNLALNYYFARKKNTLAGLIITSPWLKQALQPGSFVISLVKFFKLFLPFAALDNGLNVSDLSRDIDIVNQYKNDPLVHRKISTKLFYEAHIHGLKVSNLGYRVNIPLLLMHGSKDNITSYKSSVLFERGTGLFTTFKGWEGAFHELHNDICRNEVFQYTYNWLQGHKLKI